MLWRKAKITLQAKEYMTDQRIYKRFSGNGKEEETDENVEEFMLMK